jgi:prepilin-type processing-associated H-X9-DG protein
MPIESIFGAALGIAIALAVVAFLIGFRMGSRAETLHRSGVSLTIAAVVILAILVGGTYPLARQHGSAITSEMLYVTCAIDAALLGGFGAGRKQQKRLPASVGIYLLTTIVVAALALGHMAQVNRQILEGLQQLGIDRPRSDGQADVENKDCAQSLQELYKGFQHYVDTNDALPPAQGWMDQEDLKGGVQKDAWMHCPAVSNRHDEKYGYAYNEAIAGRKLSGKKLNAMPEAAKTPLLYDSTSLTRSAHDALTSLPKPGRHGGRNHILYCDGHVDAVAPK